MGHLAGAFVSTTRAWLLVQTDVLQIAPSVACIVAAGRKTCQIGIATTTAALSGGSEARSDDQPELGTFHFHS